MTTMREREEKEELTGEDARFVERLRSAYAPEPLSAARRTAFDARLREKLERPHWRALWIPAFSAAALAALAVWNGMFVAPSTTPLPVATASAASAAGNAWEQMLFEGDPTRVQVGDDSAELPPDYAAIEVAFFDGV
jgi:hypothetical protein